MLAQTHSLARLLQRYYDDDGIVVDATNDREGDLIYDGEVIGYYRSENYNVYVYPIEKG